MYRAFIVLLFFPLLNAAAAPVSDPVELVRRAVDNWRGTTSHAIGSMTIHRPNWERSMGFESWTKGDEKSLVRFVAPPKDAGNSSLTLNKTTWSFNPKLNRVIKIPASMVNQSWMGSDFSYRDISRGTEIINDYTHALVREEENEGKKVYVIESFPKEDAAVVWGKEILHIREDLIFVQHEFFDQSMQPVKNLQALDIKVMGGRVVAKRIRMSKIGEDEWTEVDHSRFEFDATYPDSMFSAASLSAPPVK